MTKESRPAPSQFNHGQETVLQSDLSPPPFRTNNGSWMGGRRDHHLLLPHPGRGHPERLLQEILSLQSETENEEIVEETN